MYLVLGSLGKTGESIIRFLERHRYNFWVYDDKPFHHPKKLPSLDHLQYVKTLIKSPGIPLHHDIIKQLPVNTPIINDLDLFKTNAQIIGITGTNGKTTVTHLLAHTLSCAGIPCAMGGNVGTPVLDLPVLPNHGIYVLELSSYQLETDPEIPIELAVLLNVTEDHIEHHGSFEAYQSAKWNIFNRAHHAFIPYDYQYRPKCPNGRVRFRRFENVALQGDHNHLNMAFVASCAMYFGIEEPVIQRAFETFEPLPHRLQLIDEIGGVKFINDSKATNSDAAVQALKNFPLEKLHLIVGGQLKQDDLGEFPALLNHVKGVYWIGADLAPWQKHLPKHAIIADVLEVAVLKAFENVAKGDIVLLSPGGASLDQFKNYEERGRMFQKIVEGLKLKIA